MHVRDFAYIFLVKEKTPNSSVSTPKHESIDNTRQSKKNQTFPMFVGRFHPEKSDF